MRYDEYIQRKRVEYGERFDESDLAPQFVRYFNNGDRIKVDFGDGLVLTGTVGVTTGWKPAFLLMRTSRSIGSPWTLGAKDRVIAVRRGRYYQSLTEAC